LPFLPLSERGGEGNANEATTGPKLMILQILKSVLDKALKAAYERRDKIPKGVAYGECWAANEQNIQLLQDLHLGVIRVMEEQARAQDYPTTWSGPQDDM
jgi:hypothetical protein